MLLKINIKFLAKNFIYFYLFYNTQIEQPSLKVKTSKIIFVLIESLIPTLKS